MVKIRQLVWGTFKFSNGFSVQGKSLDIDSVTEKAIVEVCRSWGDLVAESEFVHCLFHRCVAVGKAEDAEAPEIIHVIGKVIRQGTDSAGREAHFQQILVVSPEDYLALGADCFALEQAGIFKDRWFQNDECQTIWLEPQELGRFAYADITTTTGEIDLLQATCLDLVAGGRITVHASNRSAILSKFFRTVLNLMPKSVRASISLTTFTFNSSLDFHLRVLYEVDSVAPLEVSEIVTISSPGKIDTPPFSPDLEGDVDYFKILQQAFEFLRQNQFDEVSQLLDHC